jgi:hypothetical protein
MAAQATSRPDLSALPRDVRVRIAVAETQGATWEPPGGDWPVPDEWRLRGGPCRGIGWFRNGRNNLSSALPDYLSDPAAWGALLEKEALRLVPHVNGHGRAWWESGPDLPWQDTPGAAVCFAVLARHGIDPETLEPRA